MASGGVPSSSSISTNSEADGTENWLRLNLIEEKCLRQAVNNVMHNRQGDPSYNGLPTDGSQLYIKMVEFRGNPDGQYLTKNKIIKTYQWEKLCPPPPRVVSDSTDWDTPVMIFPIQYKTTLPPPIGGWKIREAKPKDNSKAANIYHARDLRNELKHGRPSDYSKKTDYDNKLNRIENILKGLDYQNMDLFNQLKTVSMEVYAKELVNIVKATLENKIKDVNIEIDEIKIIGKATEKQVEKLHDKVANIQVVMTHFKQHINEDLRNIKELYNDLFTKMYAPDGSVNKLLKHFDDLKEEMKIFQRKTDENTQSLQTISGDLQETKTNLKTTDDDLQETKANLKAMISKDDFDQYKAEINNKVVTIERKIGQEMEPNKENTQSLQTISYDLQEAKTNIKTMKDDFDQYKAEMDSKVVITERKSGQEIEPNQDKKRKAEESKHDLDDKVCLKVWEVMYESPSFSLEDWKRLGDLLGIKSKNRLLRFFRGKQKEFIKDQLERVNITWKTLKTSLQRMEKDYIIAELCAKTNLTEGLDSLIKRHKERISKETSQRTCHEQYVDLVVAESDIVDRRWREQLDEKTFHMMKFTIPTSHFRKITMNELVSNCENVTMITGIPGIGKTTLCEEIKYQWSNNKLWNGKVDLLLEIPCREINIYNFSSTTDLIKHLLKDLQDIELLNEISDRVLLILDGADEIEHIEKLSATPRLRNLQLFKEVIDQPKQQLFSKLIITSRPKVAALVRNFYEKDIKCAIKPVEVCGFNDENVQSFVQKQFQDERVVVTVMRKVKETSTMQAMSSVPIFLKSFCTVYKEDSEIKTPSTMTELLLYTLLTFFKDLYKLNGSPQKKDLSFKQLSSDKEVEKHIINLSKISQKTLAERKVVFYEEDFKCEILNELEKVGFLSKRKHEVEGFLYEYKHLVLHEVLAALHILSIDPENKREHYDNPNFRDTLPLVSGLEGILNRSEVPKYLKALVLNVTGLKVVQSPRVKSFLEEQMMEKFDEKLFKNTYLFAQNEYMEIPTEEFVVEALSEQWFYLIKRTVVRSQLIKFLTFLLPHISIFQYFKCMKIKIHSSDDVQQLVDISRKAKLLDLHFDVDVNEKLIEYFKKLSQPSESFCVEVLHIYDSLKLFEINVEDFHFLCNLKEVVIINSDSSFFFIEILEKLFSAKEMMLQRLRVVIDNDERLHAISRLFQYVPSILIYEHCNEIIHQYMNKNNKLKVLEFSYFPALSFVEMVYLQEVTVRITNDFTVAEQEHMYNELKKVKNEEERSLKVVNLELFSKTVEDAVDFINSLNFVCGVSSKDDYNITITI